MQQLLAGLDVAHRAGLVHRDVKLDNLFLCDEGGGQRGLEIPDFGVAKVLPGAGGTELPGLQTEDGIVIGTPRFIPRSRRWAPSRRAIGVPPVST